MPLPFLRKKQNAAVIISHRKPDAKEEGAAPDPEDNQALEACAQDIMRAISQNDHKHLALALKAAFDVMESEPHEENDENSNDYDSMNEQAAEDQE